jgi:hypothetical protein
LEERVKLKVDTEEMGQLVEKQELGQVVEKLELVPSVLKQEAGVLKEQELRQGF